MTLLVNEIHIRQYLGQGQIILAADRRITVDGKFHSNRRKLFKLSYLNAGVGYFGLAQVNQSEFFSGWLPNFIRHSHEERTLEGFANSLCYELNRKVDKELLRKTHSGFQICGYNLDGLPELWFVRNILGMEGHLYKGFGVDYIISEDFLARDASHMGYNGVDQKVNCDYNQYYVNGDVRAFHSIWRRLDEFLSEMFLHTDFLQPQHDKDLEVIVKWKMGVISGFYKQFAKQKIVGTPIDAFVLVPDLR
jgi:hypothetical protein